MPDIKDMEEEIFQFSQVFKACRKVLQALGNENRQHMIVEMLQIGRCSGARVEEITERTNLSRSAVSRHLKILKEVAMVEIRKEGTKNYYYFNE